MVRMRKYGESKTTRIMMATVPHVTSGLGLRKFQADGFLLTRVYHLFLPYQIKNLNCKEWQTTGMSIIMLVSLLPIKNIFVAYVLFSFQICYPFYTSMSLLRPHYITQWLEYKVWYAYHSLRNQDTGGYYNRIICATLL